MHAERHHNGTNMRAFALYSRSVLARDIEIFVLVFYASFDEREIIVRLPAVSVIAIEQRNFRDDPNLGVPIFGADMQTCATN